MEVLCLCFSIPGWLKDALRAPPPGIRRRHPPIKSGVNIDNRFLTLY
jgi:hypothetical protein